MHYAKILIGNTSSGILEAANFSKYVVNVGDRQKDRLQNGNVINAIFSSDDIIEKTLDVMNMGVYLGDNIYWKDDTAQEIISILKKNHGKTRCI
jgi:GDP/UDP-N,N'-diacetylbacillosamine 2-epimerase (hydrolysing)